MQRELGKKVVQDIGMRLLEKSWKTRQQSSSFGPVTYNDVLRKVKTLDTAKASQQSDIPNKILKQNSDYFAEYFYENTTSASQNQFSHHIWNELM